MSIDRESAPPWDGNYGIDADEVAIPIGEGFLVFPPFMDEQPGSGYVRIVQGANFEEVAYWIADEWAEAPFEVMGAIGGACTALQMGIKISSGREKSLDNSGPCGILPTEQTRKSDETTNGS